MRQVPVEDAVWFRQQADGVEITRGSKARRVEIVWMIDKCFDKVLKTDRGRE